MRNISSQLEMRAIDEASKLTPVFHASVAWNYERDFPWYRRCFLFVSYDFRPEDILLVDREIVGVACTSSMTLVLSNSQPD